jgi:hypothetical protein
METAIINAITPIATPMMDIKVIKETKFEFPRETKNLLAINEFNAIFINLFPRIALNNFL